MIRQIASKNNTYRYGAVLNRISYCKYSPLHNGWNLPIQYRILICHDKGIGKLAATAATDHQKHFFQPPLSDHQTK